METVVSKKASISLLAEHSKVGRDRVVLVDPDTDWCLIVQVDLYHGYLLIMSGNGSLDGWTENTVPVTHKVKGVDADYMALFAKFVCDNYVADERINDCVAYLLDCQS